MATINEWRGPQAFTPITAHWFAAVSSSNVSATDEDGTTDYFAAYTTTDDGTAPYQVTLTRTRLDFFGNVAAATAPIVTYDTGSAFSIVADRVSQANEDVFFTAQTAGAAGGTSDIDVQRYDEFGTVIGAPVTLVSGVAGLQQLRVGSAATYGQRYFVAYSTFDATTGSEQIKLLSYSTDNRLIGNETLDSFTTATARPTPSASAASTRT